MTTLETHLTKAKTYLSSFRDGDLNHINRHGAASQSGRWFDTISPVDLAFLARVARSDTDDVEAAVCAAHAAFLAYATMNSAVSCIALQTELRRGQKRLLLSNVWIPGRRCGSHQKPPCAGREFPLLC